MEKLIELFNKHIEENTGQKYYLNEMDVKDKLDSLLILRYFIKWLVDNDKIDYYLVGKKGRPCLGFYRDYEILLMLLSISETPIEDLISYLK